MTEQELILNEDNFAKPKYCPDFTPKTDSNDRD